MSNTFPVMKSSYGPKKRAEVKLQQLEYICSEIAGGLTYESVCTKHKLDKGNTWRALQRRPEMMAKYKEARRSQTQLFADNLIGMVEEKPERREKDNSIDPSWVTHQNNKINHYKWILERVIPKDYSPSSIAALGIEEDGLTKSKITVEYVSAVKKAIDE